MKLILFMLSMLIGCGTAVDPQSEKFLHKRAKLPSFHREAILQNVLDSFIDDAISYGRDPWPGEERLRRLDFLDGLKDGTMPPIDGAKSETGIPMGICVMAHESNKINRKYVATHHFIYFDGSFRDMVDSNSFKAIAYHELYHCLFGGLHLPQNHDIGIMSPSIPLNEKFWGNNWDNLVQQLFLE